MKIAHDEKIENPSEEQMILDLTVRFVYFRINFCILIYFLIQCRVIKKKV